MMGFLADDMTRTQLAAEIDRIQAQRDRAWHALAAIEDDLRAPEPSRSTVAWHVADSHGPDDIAEYERAVSKQPTPERNMQGPNVKRLIAHKMALLLVPKGGGLTGAIQELVTPGNIGKRAQEATAWVTEAIAAVKDAPNNPYGDDDEAIAGEILRLIDERRGRGKANVPRDI